MLKDEGVDPQGGKLYSRYERVRVERVWKEALGKERREQEANQGSRVFQMNLANKCTGGDLNRLKFSHNRLEIIADKVESKTPAQRFSTKGIDPTSFEVNCMRHTELPPADKFDIPCTRAQEIGWLIANPVRARTIREIARNRDYAHPVSQSAEAPAAAGEGAVPSQSFQPGVVKRKSRSTSELHEVPTTWPNIPKTEPHPQVVQMNKKNQWYKPRSLCPITKYADNYVSTMGANPYSRSQTR